MKITLISTMFKFTLISISLFLLGFSNSSWGQTTVSHSFTNTSGIIDANISFTTAQNNADNGPYSNGSQLRLYFDGSGNGCSISLIPSNGAIITDVIMEATSSSYVTAVKYNVDGAADLTANSVSTTYTVSGISASTSVKLRNANTTSKQLRLSKITVTYILPTLSPSLVATPTSLINLDYNLGSGPSAVQTFELTGSNLNGADAIELLTGTDFEISSDNISFSDYIDLGLLTSFSQTIYVRLKDGLFVGNYNDMILIAGGGVPSANEPIVNLSGEVYEAYDILFDSNGGTGTMANQSITSGNTENINPNTFTRTGYVFAGWSTSASGAVVYADNASFTMGGTDVTLYAQWTPTYDVIFDPNGGSGTMANQTIVSGATANLNSNIFTRTGYVFAGWSTSASGAVVYADNDAYTMGGTDVTLYAQWSVYVGPCFSMNGPDFPVKSGYTTSGHIDSGGSPTNTLRLASGGNSGSISATATGVSGNITVKFRAKGWDGDETEVKVTVDGNSQFILDLDDNAFTERTLTYSSVSADPIIEFSTVSGKRVHIGNVKIFCAPVCIEPSTQASLATFSSITNNSMDLSWTNGDGDGRIVVMKEASAITGSPTSGTTYSANATFGSGDVIAANEYVVYNGTGNSTTINGLECGKTYHISVFEYNTTDVCYSTAPAAIANASTLTPTITTTPTSLTSFSYLLGSGPSSNQDYSLEASNLFPLTGNITVTPSTSDYEVSTDGTSFSSSLSLPYTSGALGATTIYVRLKSGLAVNPSYTANVVNTYSASASCDASSSVSVLGEVTAPTPSIVLNSSNPSVPSGNTPTNSVNNIIYSFNLDVSVYEATLSGVSITTGGTYGASDLNNLKCWYSTDAVFDAGDQLLSTKTSTLGSGSHVFPSFTNQVIANGATGYVFITADIGCANAGNTISVSTITTADITFLNGNKSGTAYIGGTKTFVDGAISNVSSLTTSDCVSGGTTVNWVLPSDCYDEVLVFATSSSFTAATPSGDGSAYSANTTFGSGTSFDGGSCVYKGTGTSESVTGLTNEVAYTYKVFTRKGTLWSSGVTVGCTPLIAPCEPTYTANCSGDDLITKFSLESIDNTSGTTCSSTPLRYSDYTSFSTDLTQGTSYTSLVSISSGGAKGVSVWIDFNNDGDFEASENVGNSTGMFASGSSDNVLAVNIPLLAATGVHRMRVRTVWNVNGSDIHSCNSYSYGEVEDYTVNIIALCTSTASISSFMPTSGPAGTIITITGSGFTGTTDVKFGTVDATSFTIVDDNTITAEVPAGIGNSETISVFDASACEEVSVDTYSLTTLSGACSAYPGYTDLFMSEVYDHNSGDGWYLELYNPTSSPIVLTGVYKIERYGNLNLTGNPNLIDLVGTVPPMSVFVIQLHSDVTCSDLSVDFQTPGNWGINENDRIRLVKNGTVVDDVSTPSYTGYTIVRDIHPSGVAPSDVYPTEGWTTGSNDCSDLGFFTLTPATNIDVTSPTDVSGCSLNMSVTSTTPGVTYSWKFNDPTTNTWLAVNSTNLPGVTITGETTYDLSITGDLAFMEDFQFYCEVSESGCSSASDAAQFNTDSRPIYRSVAGSNGGWSDYTNWEMSYDYNTYVPACTYPRDINSSEVIIQAGTYIRLDLTGTDDVTIDKVTIENTGTLEIEANAQLTVNNSVAASDFIVNGTLFDRTNATNVMVFVTGATWELGANGTVIKSNESDVDFYRDVYEGGMANIPATADWIYRFNNDGDPTVGTIDFFYPNLSFENTTATAYSFGGNFNSFNGNTGFATVKGNFDIGVTGSSTCLVSNANFNVQPMLIYGNMHVDNGSGLVNYNTATTEFGTGFELKGDLLVDGTLSVLSGATERVFRFTGTTDQTVSGTGIIDLYKMTVNKTTGNVLLNRDLQAQNELVMAQGHIFTNTSLLELGLSTTQKGILNHTNDYVVGKMRRWFDGTNSGDQTGLYPMGYDDGGLKNRNTKIEFTTASTDGGHLTVEYINVPMGPAGLTIPAINSGGAEFDVTTTEDQGYWKIDNEPGRLTDGDYTIACTGEGYVTITDLSMLTLLKRVIANSPDWFCPGIHLPSTGTIAMPTVSREGVSGWSNFGFGSVYDINPLPVTLTSFEVDCSGDNKQINIRWSTSSESNSSHFVVEKSRDMAQWSTVSQVPAAGNSTHHIDYSELDEDPWSGIVYYRLKQFDFNGDTEVFNAISASCSMEESKAIVYPNPSNGDFTVEVIWNGNATDTQLQVVDVTGRIVGLQDVILKEGTMQFYFNQIDLKPGIYRVVFPNTELKPLRVLVAH